MVYWIFDRLNLDTIFESMSGCLVKPRRYITVVMISFEPTVKLVCLHSTSSTVSLINQDARNMSCNHCVVCMANKIWKDQELENVLQNDRTSSFRIIKINLIHFSTPFPSFTIFTFNVHQTNDNMLHIIKQLLRSLLIDYLYQQKDVIFNYM